MPVLLPDDLALVLFRSLTKLPPVSGHVIQQMLSDQSDMLVEQQKLLLQLQSQVNQMSQTEQSTDQQFQAELAAFGEDLRQQTTVANGLKVAFAGVAQKLAEATAAALAAGASEAELTSLRALHADVIANTGTMASAITENTQAAGEPSAPVEPTTTVDPAAVDAVSTGEGETQQA